MMFELLEQSGFFSSIDVRFARLLTEITDNAPANNELFLFLAALISRQVTRGNTSLPARPEQWFSLREELREEGVEPPSYDDIVTVVDAWSSVIGRAGERKPIIYDRERLYLQRYYVYETAIADRVLSAGSAVRTIREDTVQLARHLFLSDDAGRNDAKKGEEEKLQAAVSALTHDFSVISGGPGTGKTYTIARIIALILVENSKELVALAAPTGKAASRMGEAVSRALSSLSDVLPPELFSVIKNNRATSIHSLIGWEFYGGKKIYDRENPLPYTTVIVDEASMIDADITAALFEAVRPDARIIFVGDKDQLASVEAGSIMAALCAPLRREVTHPAKKAISELTVSYRFSGEGGIGSVAKAVNGQRLPDDTIHLLRELDGEVEWIEPASAGDAIQTAVDVLLSEKQRYFSAQSSQEALSCVGDVMLLTPMRHGPFGVVALNIRVEQAATQQNYISAGVPFYHLRPIMITQNDKTLSLFNGDTGVLFADKGNDRIAAVFAGSEEIRLLSPYYLPSHETAYAMTVHKSQGSEFNHIILLLPDRDIPLVTVELLYTAITRAKKKFTLIAKEDILRESLSRRIVRSDGLEDRIWSVNG